MRTWLLSLQSGLMRIMGIRRLGADLSLKLDVAYAGLDARLDRLRTDLFEQGSSIDRRVADLTGMVATVQTNLSALRDEEGGRARSATERGDTLDVNIHDFRRALAELVPLRTDDMVGQRFRELLERSVGDLRVELSSIRADIAREIETIFDEHAVASQSLVEMLTQVTGDLRVEMSSMRSDMAREMEVVNDKIGTSSGLLTGALATSFSDLRGELSNLRESFNRETGALSDSSCAVAERRTVAGQLNR